MDNGLVHENNKVLALDLTKNLKKGREYYSKKSMSDKKQIRLNQLFHKSTMKSDVFLEDPLN